MIVVLSPDYVLEKSVSLLEFKLGLLCQNNIATQLVVVEHQPLQRAHPNVQQLRGSAAFVLWEGEKSKRPGSKFWKALRLALPLRSLSLAGSTWNESCSSHSDVSLDHVQKKRGRLKARAEAPSSRQGIPIQRGAAPLPRSKAKDHPKPFLACRCCVAYCSKNPKLKMGHGSGLAKAKRDALCHKALAGEPTGPRGQHCDQRQPAESQRPALHLHPYADFSNNNDLYVL